MGRLIDLDKVEFLKIDGNTEFNDGVDCCVNRLLKQPLVEAIPKAGYEARLKADMVAILEELKKEIIELPFPQREPEYMQGYSYCQMNILDYVIQEKINALRGNKDEP